MKLDSGMGRFLKYAPSTEALFTPFLVAASQIALTIKANTCVKVINGSVHSIVSFDADTIFAVADYLDTGVIQAGKDYYVYALDFIPAGKTLPILVSQDSSWPLGADDQSSRKIGGFHTLCCAVGTIAGHTLTGLATAAILPNSVWCLNFRSSGQQGGHKYSPSAKIWDGIYGQSSTGLNTKSSYGAVILDTRSCLDFIDDLGAVGDRLLTDHEFQLSAEGSNQKTNIYGSLDPVTWGQCRIYLSKTGSWTAGVPTSAWIDRTAYVPPVGAANEAQEYVITISTGHVSDPNFFTYKQRNPAGTLGAASAPIQITGAAQALADGLLITFPAAVDWVTGETATWVIMNGLVDTANRRMISNEGGEAMCGVMWQGLLDQSYRFDIGIPTYAAAAQTTPITYTSPPDAGAVPIYIKYGPDGTPYLCANMTTTGVDKVVTFGTNYKLIIKHDAAAADGMPLAYYKGGTDPNKLLFNNTVYGKNSIAFSSDPTFMLNIVHDSSAGSGTTHGDTLYFDDGAHQKLECVNGGASGTLDLATSGPAWGYADPGGNKGQVYKQGTYGQFVQVLAGGDWNSGTYCGSRCRNADSYRWSTNAHIGARGCAEPR